MTEGQLKRFWEKVDRSENDTACWPWLGNRNHKGYGVAYDPQTKKVMGAHRLSFLITNGAIPGTLFVLHSCDNPPCVNPAHLFLGTQKDNIHDAVTKGRMYSPKRRTPITNPLKNFMQTRGMSQADLAEVLGCSRKTVNEVANGSEPSGAFMWKFFQEYGEATTIAVFDTKQEA